MCLNFLDSEIKLALTTLCRCGFMCVQTSKRINAVLVIFLVYFQSLDGISYNSTN